jgi:hypothetical protein
MNEFRAVGAWVQDLHRYLPLNPDRPPSNYGNLQGCGLGADIRERMDARFPTKVAIKSAIKATGTGLSGWFP